MPCEFFTRIKMFRVTFKAPLCHHAIAFIELTNGLLTTGIISVMLNNLNQKRILK